MTPSRPIYNGDQPSTVRWLLRCVASNFWNARLGTRYDSSTGFYGHEQAANFLPPRTDHVGEALGRTRTALRQMAELLSARPIYRDSVDLFSGRGGLLFALTVRRYSNLQGVTQNSTMARHIPDFAALIRATGLAKAWMTGTSPGMTWRELRAPGKVGTRVCLCRDRCRLTCLGTPHAREFARMTSFGILAMVWPFLTIGLAVVSVLAFHRLLDSGGGK